MPPRRQIAKTHCHCSLLLSGCSYCLCGYGGIGGLWVPTIGVLGQRMNPHHWILMVPQALVQQESKRCSRVNGWPGIQKTFGIVNPKSSKIPTVCLKSCPLVLQPQDVLHPGCLKEEASPEVTQPPRSG